MRYSLPRTIKEHVVYLIGIIPYVSCITSKLQSFPQDAQNIRGFIPTVDLFIYFFFVPQPSTIILESLAFGKKKTSEQAHM